MSRGLNELKESAARLRSLWSDVRGKRIQRKGLLLNEGIAVGDIRKDKEYRALKKAQRRLGVRIRHIEKEINKRISQSHEKEKK